MKVWWLWSPDFTTFQLVRTVRTIGASLTHKSGQWCQASLAAVESETSTQKAAVSNVFTSPV